MTRSWRIPPWTGHLHGQLLAGKWGPFLEALPAAPARRQRSQRTLGGLSVGSVFKASVPTWRAGRCSRGLTSQHSSGVGCGGRGVAREPGSMTAASCRKQGGRQEERGAGGGQAPGKDILLSGRPHADGHGGLAQVPHGPALPPAGGARGLGRPAWRGARSGGEQTGLERARGLRFLPRAQGSTGAPREPGPTHRGPGPPQSLAVRCPDAPACRHLGRGHRSPAVWNMRMQLGLQTAPP